jgi:PiT family inorganic phosphate transporter
MLGAATGLAVARTIGKGILIEEALSYPTIIGGVASVVIWTLIATLRGMPVSITHGLVAGLAAAGIATVGSGAIVWNVLQRVLTSVVAAPTLGFVGGFAIMVILLWLLQRGAPDKLRRRFSRLQILSSALMAYSHGKNDGQMPIGIMTMGLVMYYNDPSFWDRLSFSDPTGRWIIIVSSLAISSGMASGGWRVIKTLGMKITSLTPVHGFAAQTSAAVVIEIASNLGIPVSTTHCISTNTLHQHIDYGCRGYPAIIGGKVGDSKKYGGSMGDNVPCMCNFGLSIFLVVKPCFLNLSYLNSPNVCVTQAMLILILKYKHSIIRI